MPEVCLGSPLGVSPLGVPVQEELELAALQRIHGALMEGAAARSVELSDEEKPLVKHLCLLTAKPLIYAANVAEEDLADPSGNTHVAAVRQVAQAQGAEVVVVSAQVRPPIMPCPPRENSIIESAMP